MIPSAKALLENPGLLIPSGAFHGRKIFEDFCRDAAVTTEILCCVLGRYWLAVDPSDESLTPHLQRDGFWESWISVAIGRHLKPGMICVDVGANVGYFTLLMADRVGEGGAVMAVEPQPQCADLLRSSLTVNGVSLRSWCVEVAASDQQSSGDLLLYGSLHGSASLRPAPGWEITARIHVPTARLDDLVRGMPPIDFVKIDAEGSEADIWEGMRAMRAASPGLTVCMEVCSSRHYDLGKLLEQIQRDGFPLRVVNDMGDVEDKTIEQIEAVGEALPILWLQRELVNA